MAGYFTGTVGLGNTQLTSVGSSPTYPNQSPSDGFVAKLDAAGSYLWASQVSGASWEDATGIAVDAAGDAYVTGYFESYSVSFGSITLFNSSAAGEIFVAKLSGTTGQWLWARRCGSLGYDKAAQVAITTQGEVMLAGSVGGTADFGPFTLSATGDYLFVAKLSPAGAWQWVQQTATGGRPFLTGLVLDGQNNSYLAGSFEAPSLTVGATLLTTSTPTTPTTRPPGPGHDLFVAKLSDTGTPLWAIQGDPNGRNMASIDGMATDGLGHLYVGDSYSWTGARIGGTALPNLSNYSSPPQAPIGQISYAPDAFVARLNAATGGWDWVVRAGGAQSDFINGVAADGLGRVYVASGFVRTGGFDNPLPGGGVVHLGQLDGATGAWRWTMPRTGVVPEHIALDGAGRVVVVGNFSSPTATFGATTLAQQGGPTGTTGYLARLGMGPLAARRTALRPDEVLQVWPNPGAGRTVWVQGPAAGQAVQVLDALGRPVAGGVLPGRPGN